MTHHNTQHDSFVIERHYHTTPDELFNTWASAEAKARWFAGPESWTVMKREFDFRVGGREYLSGEFSDGVISTFSCYYQEIIPSQRIIYSYDMHLNNKRISVSLVTVIFSAMNNETQLTYTEQAVFLDPLDNAQNRKRGTEALLNNLAILINTQ
ncbi:MAG: SRPBCC domain-containing protein [Gammaproteobacteria bacterium]|nr:SRPBCC domain-containing protein [Gammaproteobacteria bacterium]